VRDTPKALSVPEGINQVWFMDFMHGQLEDSRTFRLLNVIDDINREAIGIEEDFSLPSERVIRELKQIIAWRDKPPVVRCPDLGFCHNDPEYISGFRHAMDMVLHLRPTQHVHGWVHSKAATGHGCITFLLLRHLQMGRITFLIQQHRQSSYAGTKQNCMYVMAKHSSRETDAKHRQGEYVSCIHKIYSFCFSLYNQENRQNRKCNKK
jgi:hypothetical protein